MKNQDIHLFYGKGYNNIKEFNYSLNKFGRFNLIVAYHSFLVIFLKKFNKGYHIVQLFSIIVWIRNDYVLFSVIVLLLLVILILLNSYLTYTLSLNMNFNSDNQCKIIRTLTTKNNIIKLNSEKLDFSNIDQIIIPGDIIELSLGDTIPCDAILLEG